MPEVAIVAALEREVAPLVRNWRVAEQEHDGRRFRFFESAKAVLVCGGMGAEAARRATEAMNRDVSALADLSVGFAGALDASSKSARYWSLAPWLMQATESDRHRIGRGDAGQFSGGSGHRAESQAGAAYGAQAVDMEAAAVAKGADLAGFGSPR